MQKNSTKRYELVSQSWHTWAEQGGHETVLYIRELSTLFTVVCTSSSLSLFLIFSHCLIGVSVQVTISPRTQCASELRACAWCCETHSAQYIHRNSPRPLASLSTSAVALVLLPGIYYAYTSLLCLFCVIWLGCCLVGVEHGEEGWMSGKHPINRLYMMCRRARMIERMCYRILVLPIHMSRTNHCN